MTDCFRRVAFEWKSGFAKLQFLFYSTVRVVKYLNKQLIFIILGNEKKFFTYSIPGFSMTVTQIQGLSRAGNFFSNSRIFKDHENPDTVLLCYYLPGKYLVPFLVLFAKLTISSIHKRNFFSTSLNGGDPMKSSWVKPHLCRAFENNWILVKFLATFFFHFGTI